MQAKLTNKQQAFCYEYTIDHNAKEAAIRAGYKEHTAKEAGCRLLTNVNCKPEIDRIEAKNRAKSDYDRQQAELDYEQVRQLALVKGDYQAANTAIRGKNKLYALEIDKTQAVEPIQAKDFTDKELETLKGQAKELTKPKLKLVKGA